MTGRTSCIEQREQWTASVERRLSTNQIGVLLFDLRDDQEDGRLPVLWGEIKGFNRIEDLLFFDRNGKRYNLKAHLKNGPSEVIWNTVNQF